MTDDERARAVLVEIVRRTSANLQPLQADILLGLIESYGREERRWVWEKIKRLFEQQTAFYGQGSDMRKYLDGMVAWCEQQAREEETR